VKKTYWEQAMIVINMPGGGVQDIDEADLL
jgi:hypothetical protein